MAVRKNLKIQALTQTISRGLGFLFFLVAARRLGAEQFGILSFALSLGAIISIPMDSGLDPLLTKWTARGEFNLAQAALKIRLLLSTGILMIFTFVAGWIAPQDILLLGSIGFYYAALINIQSHTSYFRGLNKMHLETWVFSIQKLLAILFILVLLHPNSQAATAGILLAASGVCAFMVCRLIVGIHKLEFMSFTSAYRSEIGSHFRSIFKEALPLILVLIGWNLYFKVDVILLKAFVSDDQIGYYSTAYKLLEGINIFPSIFLAALFPALAKQSITNPLQARKLFRKALWILVPTSIVILTIVELSCPLIIETLFGSEFTASISLLRVLVISILAIFPGYLVTQTLIAYDKNLLYAGIALACAGLNVVLNLLMIPPLGALGAAWATVITEVCVTLACLLVLIKNRLISSQSVEA
ncbi:MAG: flippase [bacterium]|nr:flippase [bacterium]